MSRSINDSAVTFSGLKFLWSMPISNQSQMSINLLFSEHRVVRFAKFPNSFGAFQILICRSISGLLTVDRLNLRRNIRGQFLYTIKFQFHWAIAIFLIGSSTSSMRQIIGSFLRWIVWQVSALNLWNRIWCTLLRQLIKVRINQQNWRIYCCEHTCESTPDQ